MKDTSVVTGGFGFLGSYITKRLVDSDVGVINLTRYYIRKNTYGNKVKTHKLDFSSEDELAQHMEGATTLYNTYWIRIQHGGFGFDDAVNNTKILLKAAKKARIKKIVHIGLSNSSLDSNIPFFRGKAQVEKIVRDFGINYTIIRPTMIYGLGDVLTNNVAWILRHSPIFFMPGDGNEKMTPVYVGDLADYAVKGAKMKKNTALDAGGPELLTFNRFIGCINEALGGKTLIAHTSPFFVQSLSKATGLALNDTILTDYEVDIIRSKLLVTKHRVGKVKFTQWILENIDRIGHRYESEMKRHWILPDQPNVKV